MSSRPDRPGIGSTLLASVLTLFPSWISCFNRFQYKLYDLDYSQRYTLVHYNKSPNIQGGHCRIDRKDSFLESTQNHGNENYWKNWSEILISARWREILRIITFLTIFVEKLTTLALMHHIHRIRSAWNVEITTLTVIGKYWKTHSNNFQKFHISMSFFSNRSSLRPGFE